jgi:hypothetical protein
VVVNSAIHQISAAQLQADALRDALRNPPLRLPDEPKPARPQRRRALALLYRLRPAVV